MDFTIISILLLILNPVLGAWSSQEEQLPMRERRGPYHYHQKRHMSGPQESKRKSMTTSRPRELRKKPSGHLKPLEEDDIDNDEVVSVAIGPPPRPKTTRGWKQTPPQKPQHNTTSPATNLVRDILIQLGQEFIMKQVSEDFVFGQYVGNAMRNLTKELRLSMQHDILEIVIKYQNLNRDSGSKAGQDIFKDLKKNEKKTGVNDTEEAWPDFSNLAKIL